VALGLPAWLRTPTRRPANARALGRTSEGVRLPPAANAASVPTEGVVGFELASVAERAATAKPRLEAKARRKLETLLRERPREGVRRHEWPVREGMREGAQGPVQGRARTKAGAMRDATSGRVGKMGRSRHLQAREVAFGGRRGGINLRRP
jgi:hypothetical protein